MQMKKCPRCGFDDLVEKRVDELLTGGDDAAVVNVPAKICLHCGERIYSAETFYRFSTIRKMLASGQVDEFQPIGHYFRVPADLVDTGAEDMAKFLAEVSDSRAAQAD